VAKRGGRQAEGQKRLTRRVGLGLVYGRWQQATFHRIEILALLGSAVSSTSGVRVRTKPRSPEGYH